MKLFSLLVLLTLFVSCQDALRTRDPVEGLKSTDGLTAFDSDHLIAQINVDFAVRDNQIEILTDMRDGKEGCELKLYAGNSFNFKIVGNVFTLYLDGGKLNYQRLSAGDDIEGVWKNTRKTGLIDIEEVLTFNHEGELNIRKSCSK